MRDKCLVRSFVICPSLATTIWVSEEGRGGRGMLQGKGEEEEFVKGFGGEA
jgi:hypothetical protein